LLDRKKVVNAYRVLFNTKDGRIIIKDLMKSVRLFADTGVMDTEELRQLEGARNEVRRIIKLAHFTDEQIEALTEERVHE
jgi:hypothetical protein